MPTYVILGRLTAHAKANLADARARRDKVFSEFEKKGFRFTMYQTLGPYDAVNIVEAPSEELMMKCLFASGETGNVETATLRAFNVAEVDRIRSS